MRLNRKAGNSRNLRTGSLANLRQRHGVIDMSTTRLTFLYPHLFRSVRVSDSAANTARVRTQAPRIQCQHVRSFAASERRVRQSPQRHGKAVEPYPIGGGSADEFKIPASAIEGKDAEKSREQSGTEVKSSEAEGGQSSATRPSSEGPSSETLQNTSNTNNLENESAAEPPSSQQPATNASQSFAPLETVLQMPPPERQDQENATKSPHLQTPPYVHHFDTYTLVQQVEAGDFTAEQSITAMKAVRSLLARNLDVAKAGLVSKSDVENVSCSPCCGQFYAHSFSRKATSFAQPALNCGQRSKISAKRRRRLCAENGPCCNMRWIF